MIKNTKYWYNINTEVEAKHRNLSMLNFNKIVFYPFFLGDNFYSLLNEIKMKTRLPEKDHSQEDDWSKATALSQSN